MVLFDRVVESAPAAADHVRPIHVMALLLCGSAFIGALIIIACLSLILGPLPLWAWVAVVGVEMMVGVFIAAALHLS
jgi:hypothetical protein